MAMISSHENANVSANYGVWHPIMHSLHQGRLHYVLWVLMKGDVQKLQENAD